MDNTAQIELSKSFLESKKDSGQNYLSEQIILSNTLAALDEIAGLMELIREQKKDSDMLPKFEDYYAKTVKRLEEYAVKIEKLIEDSENIEDYDT